MDKEFKNHTVHKTLAHSYIVYFLILVLGVCLDLLFPIRIFHTSIMAPIGFVFLVFASFIIFWAQKSSRDLLKAEEVTKEHFCRGPYCYSRTPTHWGLFFLALGFGFIMNAFFIILFTIISFIITKITFVQKQEKLLEQKFGAPYTEYKKSVKL
ncbi:MAG: hypothetical protein UU24_C0020G0005 [Candidatus Nomurabacteria bacterium GW2011_GWA2_40_9]|uniref:Isoprenylcysteine carboxyl methyltransferase n=1 Tax=Candidatus Nomurabacteria bacterium GW2011_GWA2_40_9 TaxID=1618734 RepID=A0A0G0TPR3_9BACT|nr:MAG: hypothetical protein UU24_C0020G0005 [Candidatus Nomurabacteria bacterium GW2011_GWA2_40_9]